MSAACKVWNPEAGVAVTDDGKTIKVTIQFDIQLGPGAGAVYVSKDEGNCEITLEPNKKVYGEVRSIRVSDSGGGIYGNISITPDIRKGKDNNEIVWFRVRDNHGSSGTINVRFEVDYK